MLLLLLLLLINFIFIIKFTVGDCGRETQKTEFLSDWKKFSNLFIETWSYLFDSKLAMNHNRSQLTHADKVSY